LDNGGKDRNKSRRKRGIKRNAQNPVSSKQTNVRNAAKELIKGDSGKFGKCWRGKAIKAAHNFIW